MKSIVTGGGGFIGSHLCEKLLKAGHSVTVIDNFSVGRKANLSKIKNKIKIYNKDIKNYNSIKNLFKNVDNVFHLAALADIVPSIDEPEKYYKTNVTGTLNVLKLSSQNNFATELSARGHSKIVYKLRVNPESRNHAILNPPTPLSKIPLFLIS